MVHWEWEWEKHDNGCEKVEGLNAWKRKKMSRKNLLWLFVCMMDDAFMQSANMTIGRGAW